MNESTVLKFNYTDSFLHTTTLTVCNDYEYEYNVAIKLITFKICLIHSVIQSHKFGKILINDSIDSYRSWKFIVLVYKKEERKRQRQ